MVCYSDGSISRLEIDTISMFFLEISAISTIRRIVAGIDLWVQSVNLISSIVNGATGDNQVAKIEISWYVLLGVLWFIVNCMRLSILNKLHAVSDVESKCVSFQVRLFDISVIEAGISCLTRNPRTVARKPRDATAVLFGLKFADNYNFYRAMHVVLARYCYRKSSVRPSVCPSVCL